MKNVHEYLTRTAPWYKQWHEHPAHKTVHWIALFVFAAFISFSTLSHIAAKSIVANEQITKHFIAGTVIPDDPAKVKKIPRFVALDKVKQKDKAYINSLISEGQSLVVQSVDIATLPTSVRLTAPVPLAQGGEGSCVAMSTAAARGIEEYYTRNQRTYDSAINIMSPEYIYDQAKLFGYCSGGSAFTSTLDLLVKQGVSTNQSMPYSDANGCDTLPDTQQSAEAANFKISSYNSIVHDDQVSIKTALVNHHPVLISISADSAFNALQPGQVWYPSGTGTPHAVVVVGYDDAKNAYLVMNSYGANWADNGFGWMDYAAFAAHSSYYTYIMNVAPETDVAPPSVSVTTTGGTVSGTIALAATATDNIGIAGISFRIDGQPIGLEDTTTPYSVPFNTGALSAGNHTLTALARDTSGNLSLSQGITIFVVSGDTTKPQISLTGPLSGATLSGIIPITATATDAGMLTKVTFFGQNVYPSGNETDIFRAEDTEAPFTVPWDTVAKQNPNSTYTLTATAFDLAGNSSTTAPITITVDNSGSAPDTTPPTVSITQPATGATVSGVVDISANASDYVGVTKVEFYRGTTLLYTDTASGNGVYGAAWDTTQVSNGTYDLSAKAYDAAGNMAASNVVTVLVSNSVQDSTPPVVTFTAPKNGATVSGVATLSATATDNVGISSVYFYDGSTLIGADSSAPFTVPWDTTKAANTTHTIQAAAYDIAGNIGNASISVTVNNTIQPPSDTTPPTVTITSPITGTIVKIGTNVLFTATATDNIAVASVKFYVNNSLLCSLSSSPYSCSWKAPKTANKTYTITAKAYDAAGNTSSATAIIKTSK